MQAANIKIIAMIIFANLILIFSITSVNSTRLDHKSNTIIYGYINHEPIIIDGNDDFISENGVTGGSGTENDPYIIENWIIEGDGVVDYGIFIKNTNLYFIIRNCTISNFINSHTSGIYFENVVNGCISESTTFNNEHGIKIKESSLIQIANTTCYNNKVSWYSTGIYCSDLQEITIVDCNVSNNNEGIYLDDTSTSTITHTLAYNNGERGIVLFGKNSKHNIVKNCDIIDNEDIGIDIYSDERRHISTYNIISNCYVARNGNPEDVANGLPGIGIWISSDNLIENCTIDANGRGIGIDSSKNNIIRNCIIKNHRKNTSFISDGLLIQGGLIPGHLTRNNLIVHCDIMDNEAGALIGWSFNTIFQKNNIINNSHRGITNIMLVSCTLNNNNIVHNGYYDNDSFSLIATLYTFIDARHNWWGTAGGPILSVFSFDDQPKIMRHRSILLFSPWLTEPVPDAGRQT